MTQRTRDLIVCIITGLAIGLLCIGIATHVDAGEIRVTPGDTGTGVYVPYTGATGPVNLGSQAITTTGTAATGDHTISDTTPVVQLKDTSCTDSDVNFYLEATATDTGSGTEDIDVSLYNQVAGAAFRFMFCDADIGSWLFAAGGIENYIAITATEARISGATPSIDFYDTSGDDADVNASIDVDLTGTGTGAEYADSVFSNQINGAMTEWLRMDASDSQIEPALPMLVGLSSFQLNSGATVLMDLPVSDAAAITTEESYDLRVDGLSVGKVYAQSNGAGSVQKRAWITAMRDVLTPSSTQTVANDAYIDSTNGIVPVAGDGGSATLDTAPAISDGVLDGQTIIVQGTHDTNTVVIADNCNTQLAGGAAMTLGLGDTITLIWRSGTSDWYETSRSDN